MTLTEFLLARITEDQAVAKYVRDHFASSVDGTPAHWTEARVLAECEAKRALIAWASKPVTRYHPEADDPPPFGEITLSGGRVYSDPQRQAWHDITDVWRAWNEAHSEPDHPEVLQMLALPYAGHPDYRQEWR